MPSKLGFQVTHGTNLDQMKKKMLKFQKTKLPRNTLNQKPKAKPKQMIKANKKITKIQTQKPQQPYQH